MNEKIIILIFVCVLFALFLSVYLMIKRAEIKNNKIIAQNNKNMNENLYQFQSNLLSALHHDMQDFASHTSSQILDIEKNVNEQILNNMKSTNEAYTNVLKEVGKIDEAQKHLQELSTDIRSLHLIFNDKKSRGIYGEIELYSILERSFGDDPRFYAKQYKLSNGFIVDAVLFEKEEMNAICIDSKFPLENYNRLQDASLTSIQKKVLQNEFKQNVKKHIQDIANKYVSAEETSDFAYMFIPAEAVFSYIHAYFPEIIDYSFEKKVYLASPSTLMSYISAIKAFQLEAKKNEKMQEIMQELNLLSQEFSRFSKRYENVMKDYEKTANDMKDVMISAKKISQRFAKIENVEFEAQ